MKITSPREKPGTKVQRCRRIVPIFEPSVYMKDDTLKTSRLLRPRTCVVYNSILCTNGIRDTRSGPWRASKRAGLSRKARNSERGEIFADVWLVRGA